MKLLISYQYSLFVNSAIEIIAAHDVVVVAPRTRSRPRKIVEPAESSSKGTRTKWLIDDVKTLLSMRYKNEAIACKFTSNVKASDQVGTIVFLVLYFRLAINVLLSCCK